jgi:hypothetical protein
MKTKLLPILLISLFACSECAKPKPAEKVGQSEDVFPSMEPVMLPLTEARLAKEGQEARGTSSRVKDDERRPDAGLAGSPICGVQLLCEDLLNSR